ncbi:Rrf2 family transcriptional regulator [Paenibacillus kobensis]|uniref:Rrf2 family transcriptional regulator n=1 Tax=Paenibacillus kobensis TaxID=59841 RepID=UPI000FD7BE36|nr:Rrf2 family transcriptional regulator [Paenibacillus kobensis]
MNMVRNSCSPSFRTFGLAVQAMVVLANNQQNCPSCFLAEQLQSEATLMRKIMAQLARAGLIETREGRDGGYRLTRAAGCITLADIYTALHIGGEMCRTMGEATGTHPFGMQMKTVFNDLVTELDECMLAVLSKHTVEEYVGRAIC